MASEWLDEGAFDLVWVTINDPGVSGHEGFTGEMSKYETTNAQYCEFLNAALASGDITVVSNVVKGAIGSNSGEDFEGKIYFATYEASDSSQITYSGETFSVRSRDGYDMSNHPVVIVSWYGATAFCNYYGYHLPTEWEWQAVADYDGTFDYGCGLTIDQTKANYHDNDSGYANPLGLTSSPYTSPVNHYSSYGYGMNDMAGNVCEWTSSVSGSDRVIRGGGSWLRPAFECLVSFTLNRNPQSPNGDLGFRACR
jgi:formylglycine-generating enzyme required for sulfatase activity